MEIDFTIDVRKGHLMHMEIMEAVKGRRSAYHCRQTRIGFKRVHRARWTHPFCTRDGMFTMVCPYVEKGFARPKKRKDDLPKLLGIVATSEVDRSAIIVVEVAPDSDAGRKANAVDSFAVKDPT